MGTNIDLYHIFYRYGSTHTLDRSGRWLPLGQLLLPTAPPISSQVMKIYPYTLEDYWDYTIYNHHIRERLLILRLKNCNRITLDILQEVRTLSTEISQFWSDSCIQRCFDLPQDVQEFLVRLNIILKDIEGIYHVSISQ